MQKIKSFVGLQVGRKVRKWRVIMSYDDFTDNKNPKVDFLNYMINSDEPEDKNLYNSFDIPQYENQMDPKNMRNEFRNLARRLRSSD